MIALPLIQGAQIFGILSLESFHPNAFHTEQVEVVRLFIQQVASMLQNAYLYQAEKKRAKELSSLSKATSSLVSTIEPQALLIQILKSAIMAVEAAEKGVLYIWDAANSEYYVGALYGLESWSNDSPFDENERDLLEKAADRRKPIIVRCSSEQPVSMGDKEIWHKTDNGISYAKLIIPLVHEKKVLGLLALNTRPDKTSKRLI